MKMPTTKFWIGVLSTVGVVLISMQYVGRTSPGPVTAVHAAIPDLGGGQSCSACHGGWISSMTDSCLNCHEPILQAIEAGDGLHGRIEQSLAGQCGRCHSEHHGSDFSIVNRSSFAIAGTVGPEEFEHNFVGFEMAGNHLELECSKCHENIDAKVLSEGQHRFIGLDRDCATCHKDAHEGRMEANCASCHGQVSFDTLRSTGHERFVSLVGGHGEVSCRTCHAAETGHSLELVGGRTRSRIEDRTCADCHASPHADAFLDGIAAAAGVSSGASCAQCHLDEHLSFRDEALTVTPEQHASSGFSLERPHREVACADCHAVEVGDFAARYPGRSADECRACHVDPHGGQFAGGPFVSNVPGITTSDGAVACLACHERTHFDPPAFDATRHAQTAFPLTGRHADTDCFTCHLDPQGDQPREFRGTPLRCDECHSDAHGRFFLTTLPSAPFGELEASVFGDCAHCHEAGESFADLAMPFDHAHWTGFPIRGAHAQSDCSSCHPRTAEPDSTGRTFGRVHQHFGPFEGCVTCHEDPHRGSFAAIGMPAAIDGRIGCARCHDETSFRQIVTDFDHGLWTGFGLLGKHGKIDCAQCHAPLRRPDDEGRTWARARGEACADCHADPHGGQFRRQDGRTSCADCHKPYSVFTDLAFDHERQSRFQLGEAHAKAECSACHKPEPRGDQLVIHYLPLPVLCVECHGSTEGPLRRRDRGR